MLDPTVRARMEAMATASVKIDPKLGIDPETFDPTMPVMRSDLRALLAALDEAEGDRDNWQDVVSKGFSPAHVSIPIKPDEKTLCDMREAFFERTSLGAEAAYAAIVKIAQTAAFVARLDAIPRALVDKEGA